MKERIVVGMSGGVDSAVTAALLLEQGFEVIGVTMLIWNPPGMDRAEQGGCCGLGAAEDARRVAARLGIRHYVLDFQEIFYDTVIRNYADEYRAGRTPNPCIRCNEFVKFGALLRRAEQLGADRVATGHYARVRWDEESRRWLLLRGKDARKDQSYALYRLKQEQLARTLFPLGEMDKGRTRGLAAELGLPVANKPDSQEVCFVPDNDYPAFLAQLVPESRREGEVVDPEGRVLGRHEGVAGFTIGQRKGLGVASSRPLYVTMIDPSVNRLTVAPGDHPSLFAREVAAADANLIVVKEPGGSCSVTAKIRYNMPDRPASLAVVGEDRLRVTFDEPQRAVTPGQAVVCYDGEVVVGGGVIESAALHPHA
jgi:tRNA-uridine 2-sulfurtransferase